MLTRLRVTGFKNLLDADVYFGPFTCIAGANGVGKSNLFDAISFLRLLASQPLVDAALSMRDEDGKRGDIRSLFFHHGDRYVETMRFEAEMLVPRESTDDLGQPAEATNTFLRYVLELGYRGEDHEFGPLEIREEHLEHITKTESSRHLLFPHSVKDWRESVVEAKRRGGPFISTKPDGDGRTIQLHQDGNAGRPHLLSAQKLPKTLLSSVRASEGPTAVVACNELRGWKLLQLEPAALRQPDSIRAPRWIAANGAHIPATLHHLARNGSGSPDVCSAIANRVSELVEDIGEVWIDQDDKRELLTLYARTRDKTAHPARSLSDGTLRFLALAVIEQSTESGGLFCLEEPENGIHPARIPAMLRLLKDIATDPTLALDDDNPLRQMIINTHSPAVVGEIDDSSLVVAESRRVPWRSDDVSTVRFSSLSDTWRTKQAGMPECPRGQLLSYLRPFSTLEEEPDLFPEPGQNRRRHRVIDRDDVQMMLPFVG